MRLGIYSKFELIDNSKCISELDFDRMYRFYMLNKNTALDRNFILHKAFFKIKRKIMEKKYRVSLKFLHLRTSDLSGSFNV